MSKWFRRVCRFLKDNLTTILLVIIVILLLGIFIIHTGHIRLSGEHFYYWLTPIITILGFGVVILNLRQMRKDTRMASSRDLKDMFLHDLNHQFTENNLFENIRKTPSVTTLTKLKFFGQVLYYKDKTQENAYQKIFEDIRGGGKPTAYEFENIENIVADMERFRIQLGLFYDTLCYILVRAMTSPMITIHKVSIFEYIDERIDDYMHYARMVDFEIIGKSRKKKFKAVFKTEDSMSLFKYIQDSKEIINVYKNYYKNPL